MERALNDQKAVYDQKLIKMGIVCHNLEVDVENKDNLLADLEEQLAEKEKAIADMTKQHSADVDKMKDDLTLAGAKQRVVGHLGARDKVHLLFPKLDLTPMGMWKKITLGGLEGPCENLDEIRAFVAPPPSPPHEANDEEEQGVQEGEKNGEEGQIGEENIMARMKTTMNQTVIGRGLKRRISLLCNFHFSFPYKILATSTALATYLCKDFSLNPKVLCYLCSFN